MIHLSQVIVFDEIVFIIVFVVLVLRVAKVPPEATDEVRDDESDQYKSYSLVNVKQDVLQHDLLLAGIRICHQIL